MDYKNTLNLPKTDFPMKADLVQREPKRLERWQQSGIYQRIQERRAKGEKFVLHDGPPFANGDVHIGTALNKILKDIIVKYQTLRGKSAPYVPGWDCHGLPIEFKVTQEMRKASAAGVPPAESKNEVAAGKAPSTPTDAATIRRACEAYARKYIGIQREQFKRLGVFGDWENPYLTLNKEYEADELRLFADIVEKGFVYRGKKPVYWSIPCATALAEAEVEYRDHVSQSVYVKFPVSGEKNLFILIWTTTPWTLPANLAVACNSAFSYSMVRVGGEAYLISTFLLPQVAQKCGWDNYEIIRSVEGVDLASLEYRHPFCERTGKLLAGDTFVEQSTGTGFVHIAPGHGLDDYNLGRQNGLPIYSPVDDAGCLAHTNDLPAEQQMPAEMVGKSILDKHGVSEANTAVLHELRVRDALLHQENYHHSYPFCWRSKTPVIFRAMDQWFIRVDHEGFREKALETINGVHWVPDWGKNRIEGAVKSRPDWCISRQRTWGVPLPAFYDAEGNAILDARVIRKLADLVEKHGTNIWFEQSAEQLWKTVRPEGWSDPEAVAKSNDTLDVWIDSGSSSRSVLMRRKELQRDSAAGVPAAESASQPTGKMSAAEWQADVYLEGSDQHRGWFQSSLLLSLAGNDAAPFKTVLTHGFMVDADREKISKSKQGQGGYEKPQTAEAYVARYGADIVRLWVASQDYRNDIVVSEERLVKVAETYRLLRNTLRYQLSNLFDFDPAKHSVPDEKLTGLDRWILDEFSMLEQAVLKAYDDYEFHVVYQKVSQFAAVELSAVYHDLVKDRLYTDAANSHRRRSTQTALYRVVTGLGKMLAPLIAFTADEAWEFVPGNGSDASVHLQDWQPGAFTRDEKEQEAWRALFALREKVMPELEKARQGKLIGKSLEAKAALAASGPSLETAMANRDALREILNVSQLELKDSVSEEIAVSIAHADGGKCERCWHWETNVGASKEHPTLCGRCVDAVSGAS